MLIIELRFPGGRYHATPWDAHVNEGRVEWPPAPFRLLRALVGVAYARMPEHDEAALRGLVAKLAADLPVCELPLATEGHTRHYVPRVDKKDGGDWARDKLFDAFVHVAGEDVMRIVYERTELDVEEHSLLEALLERMTYFGRAESWVEARIGDRRGDSIDAWPATRSQDDVPHDVIRLLTPLSDDDAARWRDEVIAGRRRTLEDELAAKAGAGEKPRAPSKAQLQRLAEGLPSSQFDALLVDAAAMRREGWPRPPATEWVVYHRRLGLLDAARAPGRAAPTASGPVLARFAVDSAVLPRLTDAVSIGDRIHKTLAAHGGSSLVGRTPDGEVAQGHGHAYVLSEADARGRIGGIAIYAANGFDADARATLGRLRRVWGHGGHDLELVYLSEMRADDPAMAADRLGGCPYAGSALVWESVTPFVATRHPKSSRAGVPKIDETGYQVGSPEHDLLRLLQLHGFPAPRQIQRLDTGRVGGRPTRWLSFRTERPREGNGRRGPSLPGGFRIVFGTPVRGPIVLGYGAHFGLGAFAPLLGSAAESRVGTSAP